MFYDRFKELCDQRGISCNKAALEMGLSNATPTAWKKRGLTPKADTLAVIANYFGVSMDYLLEKESNKMLDLFSGNVKHEYTEIERGILAEMGKRKSPDEFVLTEGEKAFLELFRKLTPEEKLATYEDTLIRYNARGL